MRLAKWLGRHARERIDRRVDRYAREPGIPYREVLASSWMTAAVERPLKLLLMLHACCAHSPCAGYAHADVGAAPARAGPGERCRAFRGVSATTRDAASRSPGQWEIDAGAGG